MQSGEVIAEIEETSIIKHRIMVPTGIQGKVKEIVPDGEYDIEQEILHIINNQGEERGIKLYQEWSVREPRPYGERLSISQLLVTGQRVFDTFFPFGKGTAAVPGGFGAGKTMIQHQLAKWADADIIIHTGLKW